MTALPALLLAWAIALVINVVPAFMPPTWSVLAIFHVVSNPPLLLLTVGGAAASALGRTVLALGSRRFSRVLPATDRKNAEALGEFVNRHRRWREPIFFFYCLAPLPSNPLFIAAGVGKIPLLGVTLAFFASRAIADTFWVWTAGQVSRNVGGLFVHQLTDWKAIVLQVLGLVTVVLLFRLPWAKWLGITPREEAGERSDTARSSSTSTGRAKTAGR